MTAKKRKRRADCRVCNLPDDIQNQIYDLYVRRDLKAIAVWQQISHILQERGVQPPPRSSFYNHLKHHLSPEKTALVHIAKTEDRFAESRGLKNIALSYLMSKFEDERQWREKLERVIDQIMQRLDEAEDGKGNVRKKRLPTKHGHIMVPEIQDKDMAALGRTLGVLVKIRGDDRGLSGLVQEKILEDLVSSVIYSFGTYIVKAFREAKDHLNIKLKGAMRDEIVPILDKCFQDVMQGADASYHTAVGDIKELAEKIGKVE